MNRFNTSQKIGEIVSIMPKASDIFKEYKIDFCCGGNRPLSEAVRERNLRGEEILKRLDEAYSDAERLADRTDYKNMPSGELIDHIVGKHHAYLKRVLPEISGLTAKILRVHGPRHNELFTVHKLFHSLKTELEAHLIKEEEMLFPMIKEYAEKPSGPLLSRIAAVTGETEAEHDTAGGILKELRKITNDYSVPDDGCGTYRMTFDMLGELEADLFVHIHLENNILFKRLGIKA